MNIAKFKKFSLHYTVEKNSQMLCLKNYTYSLNSCQCHKLFFSNLCRECRECICIFKELHAFYFASKCQMLQTNVNFKGFWGFVDLFYPINHGFQIINLVLFEWDFSTYFLVLTWEIFDQYLIYILDTLIFEIFKNHVHSIDSLNYHVL